MKRKKWTDAQPIAAGDLTDIGILTEEALGELALSVGPGRLNGLTVSQTPTASGQAIVAPGRALIHDPSVGRPRLVSLLEPIQVNFAGRSSGDYAIIITAQEREEDLRTIVPPPPGHPFFEPGLLAHDFSTGVRWVAGISVQAMPYTPSGAQAILSIVAWDGGTVVNAQITPVLDFPTPLVASNSLRPNVIAPGLAGRGLERSVDGSLSVAVDGSSVVLAPDSAVSNAIYRVSIANGGITDAHLGNRQMMQTPPPEDSTVSTTSTNLIRYLAGAISGITGKSEWNIKPDTTIAELAQNVTRRNNNEAIAGNWTFTQPLLVGDATLPQHAVTKKVLDASIGGLANASASGLATHRNAGVLDHPDGSVTDAKIGVRSVNLVDVLPSAGTKVTSDISTLFGLVARNLQDIKGTSDWFGKPDTTVNQLNQRLSKIEGVQGHIAEGSINDALIGPRIVDDNQGMSGNTGALGQILSALAGRLRAITGMDSWRGTPPTNLTELHANVARKTQPETVTGEWTFSKPLQIAEPAAENHAVTLGWVNRTISTLSGGTSTGFEQLIQQVKQKAPLGHTHSWSEIQGKPTSLEGYGITEAVFAEIGGYNPGRPVPSEAILMWVATRITNLNGKREGRARCLVPPRNNITLNVEINGSTAGRIYFNAGQRVGTVDIPRNLTLSTGDALSVRMPALNEVDPDFADVAVTFAGEYTFGAN